MPLYTFHCADCEREFEELVSINKIDSVQCPECDSNEVERLLSLVAGLSKSSSAGTSQPTCAPGGG